MISSWKKKVMDVSPHWLLVYARNLIRNSRRRSLKKQKQSGQGLRKEQLICDLARAGIGTGDSLLVHSSLSKLGYVEGGAETVVNALLDVIGPEGTLLMPSFPASGRNRDYILQNPVFDINVTPSAMGTISEYFRKMPGVHRSFHPTDPVCAFGPKAVWFTGSHFGQITPYTALSPFGKLAEDGGKILMLGTTLNGACTSLHTLEDAVDFPYPVYDARLFEVKMMDEKGIAHNMLTRVHNPEYSVRRNCDALKPEFIKQGVLHDCKIGKADSMLIDARLLLEVMIRNFNTKGVTMYTPLGTTAAKS